MSDFRPDDLRNHRTMRRLHWYEAAYTDHAKSLYLRAGISKFPYKRIQMTGMNETEASVYVGGPQAHIVNARNAFLPK